jgi:hypothetical protein
MNSQKDYRELYISKEDFDNLRSDRQFAKLLNLARAANALYFCYRALLDFSDDSTSAGQRQHINAFLFSAGVLHEGLIVADTLEKYFGERDSYRNGFGKLLNDESTKQLRNTILKRMRNKFVFHYDEDVPRKSLKTLNLPSYLFATGLGEKRRGLYYNLADEVVINFLLGDPASKEEERIFREALENITKVLVGFTDSADMLIADVLSEMNWKVREGKEDTETE